ncbi:unnamed protein product [Debaryomyces fabryi]|nr:unnamed protein product [Debaryomyces fabryi]
MMLSTKYLLKIRVNQIRFASFQVPKSYVPSQLIRNIPFKQALSIWYQSLKPGRLQILQDELTELMLPTEMNSHLIKENKKVKIDDNGNYLNELYFEINNNSNKPTKHVVFIHGYGASLGCFARNYQIINRLQDRRYNYKVHFLDNISFGLSSNPKIASSLINGRIPTCPSVKMNDPEPTTKENVYNKYYKLIESYEINKEEFKEYQDKFIPILNEMEKYYIEAIEKWRIESKIEKIDYLVGHSFGGYWTSSYAVKYLQNLSNLILLSPVGVERHVHAVTNPIDEIKTQPIKPSIDPTSYNFLTRMPMITGKHIINWYTVLPYLPKLLRWLGPWGVTRYYKERYGKLFKVNKVTSQLGGASGVFQHENDLIIGTNEECYLLFEYLYNSTTIGSQSDIYIKYLLTPCTVSKWPLFDKFTNFFNNSPNSKFKIHLVYGEYDFMNSEAGLKLTEQINRLCEDQIADFHKIPQGGHNMYLDNPFDTNKTIENIIQKQDNL